MYKLTSELINKINMKKNKIVCLPPTSEKNPYQYLMIKGLKKNKSLKVLNGFSSRYLGILLSALIYKPDFIHFDWINKYYLKKNKITTSIFISWFLFQIFFISKIMKIKVVWTMHNISPHDSNQIDLNKLVQQKFINQCKWVRVFSQSTIEKLKNIYSIDDMKKIIAVPEGSYVNYYQNNISKKDAQKQLKIKNGKIFLYIGTIKPYKGILSLIKSLSELNDKNIKLIIAGKVINKLYLDKINQSIKNKKTIILINKFIDPDDLQIYFNASDAVVLPFNNIENSGSAILAMGFKKTIIAPKIGVLPKRLINQKDFLYTDNLKSKLIKVINTEDQEFTEIGEKNFNELKKYKWEDFGKFFLN